MTLEELREIIEKEHWYLSPDLYVDAGSGQDLIELIETGSVTITVAGKQYILSIHVEEGK